MKHFIMMVMATLGIAFASQAQVKPNKNAKVDIEVKGNCDMCKKRIEKAAFKVKGVRTADYHIHDQTLHVILDETKTSVKTVQEAVAKTGHDTKFKEETVKATDEAYASLHACCVYERES